MNKYLFTDAEIEIIVRESLNNWFFVKASETDTKGAIQKRVSAFFNLLSLKEWRTLVSETVSYAGTKHLVDIANELLLRGKRG